MERQNNIGIPGKRAFHDINNGNRRRPTFLAASCAAMISGLAPDCDTVKCNPFFSLSLLP